MTGQENERSAPLYLYEKGERSMNYDPELAALLSQPWSEGACRGYVISAMAVSYTHLDVYKRQEVFYGGKQKPKNPGRD